MMPSFACEKQTRFILTLPVASTVGMQIFIYLFILCFLQLKKEATSSSIMPSVVGVAYTPSCTKGEEVNNS